MYDYIKNGKPPYRINNKLRQCADYLQKLIRATKKMGRTSRHPHYCYGYNNIEYENEIVEEDVGIFLQKFLDRCFFNTAQDVVGTKVLDMGLEKPGYKHRSCKEKLEPDLKDMIRLVTQTLPHVYFLLHSRCPGEVSRSRKKKRLPKISVEDCRAVNLRTQAIVGNNVFHSRYKMVGKDVSNILKKLGIPVQEEKLRKALRDRCSY